MENVPFTENKEAFNDPGVNEEVISAAEEKRQRILEPVLNGERSEMYKSFKDFEEKGVFDIKGAKLKVSKKGGLTPTGWKQLQAAMEIYRSKEFETFRYIIINEKTGEIADQLAITSHLPNFCNVSKPNDETIKQVISRMEELGEDYKLAVCHNHPSGNTTESSFDRELTDTLDRSLRRSDGANKFLGHIILDHATFNLAVPSESRSGNCHWKKVETLQAKEVDRFVAEKNLDMNFMNANVGGPEALKVVAMEVNDTNNWNDDFIPVVFTNADRNISGVQYYTKNFFENESDKIRNKFQFAAMEAGAIGAFPVITDSLWEKLGKEAKDFEAVMKAHVMNDAFTDVAFNRTTMTEKYDIEAGRSYFNFYRDQSDRKIDVVSTWTPEVNPLLFPPEGVGEEIIEIYDKHLLHKDAWKNFNLGVLNQSYVTEPENPFNHPSIKDEFNGFWIPTHNAYVMKKGLEENKAPFLPDVSGIIKAEPIYNGASGYCLPALRLIPVQFAKMENGFNSNIVFPRSTVNALENSIKENEKGVFYNFKDEQGEIHVASLFFPEQTQNPANIINRVKDTLHPDSSLANVFSVIASSEPREYLGTYMAACRSGMKLSVDPQLAEEFKMKIMPILENDIKSPEERNKDLPSLSNILFDADKRGVEIMKSFSSQMTRIKKEPLMNYKEKAVQLKNEEQSLTQGNIDNTAGKLWDNIRSLMDQDEKGNKFKGKPYGAFVYLYKNANEAERKNIEKLLPAKTFKDPSTGQIKHLTQKEYAKRVNNLIWSKTYPEQYKSKKSPQKLKKEKENNGYSRN